MKNKYVRRKLGIAIVCIAVLSACSNNNEASVTNNSGTDNSVNTTIVDAVLPEKASYKDDDFLQDWTTDNPTTIEFNGVEASIDGTGTQMKDGDITITTAGTYVLSGKLDDGQIIVDVAKDDKVRLVMNGVELNNSTSSSVFIKEADKVIITLQEGTKNIVSDGATYEDVTEDGPSAAIFSKEDLSINGEGMLIIHGNYKDGLTSKDDVKVTGGTIEIHAVDDGIVGRDLFALKDGTLSIEAGGDGIKTTNEEASKGNIAIEGGTLNIKAGSDGMQAAASIRIDSGYFDIITGGGSVNAEKKVEQDPRGKPPVQPTEQTNTSTSDSGSPSAKALKAKNHIIIHGGKFVIDCADDGVHSNGTIMISDGELKITAGDDGIHADASITIEGSSINIIKSYEGIESAVITISNGDIYIVANDDGINIAGGNDGSSTGGRPGQNQFAASSSNKLLISGGTINVDAMGDGLDSNGSIEMSGGTVIVNGPTASMNGALDYDGTFDISGGTLVAVGSAGMALPPSEQSSQLSILMSFSKTQPTGIPVHLKDNNSNTIATVTPTKAYQTIVYSSPELKKESTYSLFLDHSKVVDFKPSNSITWLNESGVTEARTDQRGPGFGQGGDRQMPDRPAGNRQMPDKLEGDIPIQMRQ